MDFVLEYIVGWHLPEIICLIVGIILLIAEIFMPGFGLAGGLGIACLIAALVLRAGSEAPVVGLVTLALILLIMLLFGFLFFRSFQRGKLSRSSLVLQDSIQSTTTVAKEGLMPQVGMEGTTINDLRPSGNALFGETRLDVVTEAGFLKAGTLVKITKIEGPRIVVMPVTKPASSEPVTIDAKPSDTPSDSGEIL